MLDRLRRFTRWNRVYGGASSRSNVLRPSRPMTRHPALLLLLTTLFIGGHQATAGRQAAAQEPPKLNLAGELQALGGLDSGLAGDLGLGEGETLTLTATLKAVEGGPAGILELDATIAADWHLYSLTQPPGGPLRTKLEVQATPPLELTGTWKASQPPKVRRVPEYPGVDLEEHSDKVTWTVPVKLPPGANPDKYAVRVKLSGLTCRDNDSCLPVKLTANVKLVGFRSGAAGEGPVPAAGGATATDDAAGKNAAGTNAAGTNSAEKDAAPAPPAATNRPAPPPFTGKPGPYRAMLSHGEIDGHVTSNAVGPGGMVSLVLTAKPQPGWHFYTVAETDPEDGSPFKPTLLAIDLPPGWSRSAVVASKSTVSKAVPGKPPAVFYEGEVSWSVELRAPASVAAGPQEIRGILAYQTCDDRSCDRPTGVAFRAVVELASDKPSGGSRAPLEFQASSYGKGSTLAKAVSGVRANLQVDSPARTPRSGVPAVDAPASPGASQTGTPAAAAAVDPNAATQSSTRSWNDIELVTGDDKDATLGSVLLLAMVGGFLLNFMPCVLPVIGLKVMSFVNQAHGNRRQVFLLNLYYFLGLMAVFLVLATLAAVFQFGWGKQFQSTGFNLALAAIVFVFALSMLGVWEIPLPGFVGSGAAAEASEQEGPFGAFLKGALTTVLATPCTGPFMGTALTWAAKQPPPVIYATFTALGLGMGLPYLAIGAFPRLLKFLPKPGMWMETFKQVMGFVLLGTVVFIFTFLDKDYLVPASGLMVGLGVACWWIGQSPVYADLRRKLFDWSVAIAMAGVLAWVSFTAFGPSDALLPWKSFSRPELERQLASGHTVLVDFTADWCLTCKVNEATALNTKKTLALIESQQVVVVKADKTHDGETSEAIDKLLEDLGHRSLSIPFLVIFPGNGDRPIAFSGPVTQRMVLDAIRRAGPSRPQGLAADPPARRDS